MHRPTGTTSRLLGGAIAAGLLLAGCSSGSSDDAASGDVASDASTSSTVAVNAGAEVEVSEYRFLPSQITIDKDQFVQWTNDGDRVHLITHDTPVDADRKFKSDNIEPGQSFQFMFTEPGTYEYFCAIHPDTMHGTVVVS